ncbi:MAG TPA: hypothetical protein EYG38_15275, partial [Verrucomicrobia bacterium]|nr:hypothetical protein [Verrucomicrobiota bacterium]
MKKVLVLIFFGAPFLLLHAVAQDSLPKVVSRYEQILARNPRPGIAFEKVYQHFFADQGLDELAVRWQRLEGESKTSAGYYLILQGLLAERREFYDLARA